MYVQLSEMPCSVQGRLADTTANHVYMENVNDTKNTKTAPRSNSEDSSGTRLVLLFNRKILQNKSMARTIKDI